MLQSLDIRLAHELRKAILDVLADTHSNLTSGSQIVREDAAATGMNYARLVGYAQALKLAITLIEQTERQMTGKAPERGRTQSTRKEADE